MELFIRNRSNGVMSTIEADETTLTASGEFMTNMRHEIVFDAIGQFVAALQKPTDDITRKSIEDNLNKSCAKLIAARKMVQGVCVCDASNNPASVKRDNQIVVDLNWSYVNMAFYSIAISNKPFKQG